MNSSVGIDLDRTPLIGIRCLAQDHRRSGAGDPMQCQDRFQIDIDDQLAVDDHTRLAKVVRQKVGGLCIHAKGQEYLRRIQSVLSSDCGARWW